MLRRQLLIAAATGVCVIGSLLGPAPVRFPLAVVLLVLLPGAAITELLLPAVRDRAEWFSHPLRSASRPSSSAA